MKETQVAKLIFIQNSKVLLLKEWGRDVYGLPGGKVEDGETAGEGLVREVREELGCKPANQRVFSEISIPGWNEGEIYHFIYFIGDIEGTINVGSEIECFEWVGKKDHENGLIKLHPHMIKTGFLENLIDKGLVS